MSNRSSISGRIASVQARRRRCRSRASCARVEPVARELVGERQHVARRDHDDLGPKSWMSCTCCSVMPPGHRDHRAAEPLGAVVGAQPAGEQPVAVGDVHHVARSAARRAHRARHRARPTCRGRLRCSRRRSACPSCPTRRGCARPAPAARRTCRTDRCRADRRLGREREFRQVGQLAEVVRVHPGRREGLPVMRHIVVGVPEGPGHPRPLQRLQRIARKPLDRVEQSCIPAGRRQTSTLHLLAARRVSSWIKALTDRGHDVTHRW